MPQLPANAAEALTLRSPESVVLDVQAERLPDSNPSAKIKSEDGVGVAEAVAVGPPGVLVAVGVFVCVAVGVCVAVCEAVAVGPPGVCVAVAVGVLVFVGVRLGVLVFVAVGVCEGVAVFVAVGTEVGVDVGAVPFPVTETRRFSAS